MENSEKCHPCLPAMIKNQNNEHHDDFFSESLKHVLLFFFFIVVIQVGAHGVLEDSKL